MLKPFRLWVMRFELGDLNLRIISQEFLGAVEDIINEPSMYAKNLYNKFDVPKPLTRTAFILPSILIASSIMERSSADRFTAAVLTFMVVAGSAHLLRKIITNSP